MANSSHKVFKGGDVFKADSAGIKVAIVKYTKVHSVILKYVFIYSHRGTFFTAFGSIHSPRS